MAALILEFLLLKLEKAMFVFESWHVAITGKKTLSETVRQQWVSALIRRGKYCLNLGTEFNCGQI